MDEPNDRRPGMELMQRPKPSDIPTFKVEMMPPPEPERTPPPPVESAGLFEYWQMIVRRKWLLGSIALGCGIFGLLISLLETPMYQARTSLEVQGPNDSFLNLKDLDPASSSGPSAAETYVETQAHILQDEGFVENVVNLLGVERRPEALGGPGVVKRLQRMLGMKTAGRSLSHEAVVGVAVRSLSVHSSTASHVVEVTFDAADPQVAANFANALANQLINQNIDGRLESARRVNESLGRQLVDLKANYEHSASTLQEYARSTGLIFNAEKGSTVAEEKLREIQEDESRAQADLATKQAKYELAKSASPESLPEVLDNGPLKEYQIKLTDLRRQLAEMEATFTPTYFKVKNVKAQITELEDIMRKERSNIVDRLRNEYEAAVRREKLVQQAYLDQSKIVSDEASRAVHYNVLKREVETNRAMYEATLQKVKEAGIAAVIRASNIRVISEAKPPVHPYRPRRGFNAGMGLLAGLFLGFAFVFVRENTDRSLRAPGDIATYLNLPELAAIPTARLEATPAVARRKDLAIDIEPERTGPGERAKAGDGPKDGHSNLEMISCSNETSPMAESFRAALASLWFAGQSGKRPRMFVLTSPNAREGKTTLTSNLGIALANTKRRVLLIDGDIRKPRLHTIFNVSNRFGLGNLLEDDCPIEDYVFEDIVLKTRVPVL